MAWSEPPWLRARAGALGVALIVIGCARPKPSPPASPPTAKEVAPNRTALRLATHDGLPVRAWVPFVKDGVTEHLLFDTGAEHTHLGGPRVPGPDGRDVIGIAGADEVTHDITELDLREGAPAIIHHARLPDGMATWTKIEIEHVKGFVMTNAEVDGRTMRLLVDTGTDALLVLDPDIAEDTAQPSHDAFGNGLRMVPRWAMLRWDTPEPRRVRSWHLRSHPAFEAHAKHLGGADGILGLATLGARRVVFDVKNGSLYLL